MLSSYGSQRPNRHCLSLIRDLGVLMLVALLGLACQSADGPATEGGTKPPKTLTFMAGYKPQANLSFVGVYVAQEKGFFKDENLEVEIKHSSGQGEHGRLLVGKQIQVTTAVADSVVTAVANEDIPWIAIALVTQKSEGALVTLKDSGIDSLKQLEGKTVGYKVRPTYDYVMMLKRAGVDRSQIQEVSVGFDPRVLIERKVDALPVFKSNEPDLLRKMGFDVNLFDPSDYGAPSLGQTWIVHRDALSEDPDLYTRFLKASLKGLSYALEHVPEAVDIVMKYAPKEDRAHQEYMLKTEAESALTDETRKNGLGWQTIEQWSQLQDAMLESGEIERTVDAHRFFDDSLLKSIYWDGQIISP